MKRPKIKPIYFTAENGGYNYYSNLVPNKLVRRFGYSTMSRLLKPIVLYASDEESGYHSGYETRQHLNSGRGMMEVVNHVSTQDSTTVAAVVHQEELLSAIEDLATIPAVAMVHRLPFIGRFAEQVGAHPTFRKNYYPETEEGKELRDDVSKQLILLDAGIINKGGVVVSHAEGGCRPENPSIVKEFRLGIGLTALELANPSEVLCGSIGLAYLKRIGNFRMQPIVAVGQNFCPAGMSAEEVIAQSHMFVQEATTAAFNHALLLGSSIR